MYINGDRLWESLMEMARIGATPAGGVCRLALSEEDRKARDLFRRWCEEAGCTVRVDPAGNMFARRPGQREDLAPVAVGSHLDSQPTGGRFDGASGVLAGLEIVRTLNDSGIETSRPVEVINWTNEEGARFGPVMQGSGAFTGVIPLEEARATCDEDGRSFGEALDAIGYAGDAPLAEGHPLHTMLETHIEQGPLLERNGLQAGIVTSGQGIVGYLVDIKGEEGHAGTTPMDQRRDALVAAAEIITAIHALGHEFGPSARLTVGRMSMAPGSPNTIPGRTRFTVDMRDPDSARLDTLDDRLAGLVAEVGRNHGVETRLERRSRTEPVRFDADVTEIMRRQAEAAGIGHMDLISGAGHDACHLAAIAPTGLLFVPCREGISHNEAESAKPGDLAAGCEVLYRTVLERTGSDA